MPGIVGLITNLPRMQAERELCRMVESIRHESFYATRWWIDETLGVYVGWAARANSFCDGMPLGNERGDAVLVFSGEEFPEPGTAQRLKERSHDLPLDGSSYLVHLYEEDPTFLRRLNGRFHGLLADRKQGVTTLFNDRYGMHRLYYHESKNAFYFAAEAKAILSIRPKLRRIAPRALGEFITCGCVLENRTLFEGINVLPPGSAWEFRNGSLNTRRTYFDPREWEAQETLGHEAYFQQLKEAFSRNLPRYFKGGEPIGMSLTGGLDGRMIMAWSKAPPGELPCYTFGGTYRDCRDVTVARKVAKVCGQSHQVITVGKDFLSRFPYYAERAVYLSDGCVEVNRAPDLFVNEKARQIAPVRMTGNYGSEVLRANRAFKPQHLTPGLFDSELLPQFREARDTYAALTRTHPVTFAAFRQAPWHHYGLLSLEQMKLTVRSPFLDNDLVCTAFRAPRSALQNAETCLRLIAEGDPVLRRILADRGLAGDRSRLVNAIARSYLEFTFKAEYAYDYGMPQWVALADHFFSPFHLESLFLGRHKFYHFRVWYRDVLSSYIRAMLLDSRSLGRPYLQRRMVEAIVQGHTRGGCNYTTEIHKLLTLELVHRVFID